MQISVRLQARARSLIRYAGLVLLGLTCLLGISQTSFAAVVLDGVMLDNGNKAELAEPTGVDADSLGNVYVADHWTHRIVKFDKHGQPKLVMGGLGSKPSQLSGPVAVAVGETDALGTLVYVADANNGRITVFNDLGKYKATYDTANGVHLNGPHGVAFVGNGGGGGLVLVADSLNYRIVIFHANGQFFKAFSCPTCPGGGILPVGIAGSIRNGVFRIL